MSQPSQLPGWGQSASFFHDPGLDVQASGGTTHGGRKDANLSRPELSVGLDIGSTTVKAVVLDSEKRIVFQEYARHFSDTRACALKLLRHMEAEVRHGAARLCVTGSGGISVSRQLGCPFIQEVLASGLAIREKVPDADVVIELGGEDAKLTYLSGGLEQRMNETCAGGTGAFIDQMAAFIGTDAAGLDELASNHQTIYPIASRCGVFAKSDILPLLNEGCAREDIAASIMQAVASQTISGLAQGRTIRGKVVFLGGPLHFLPSLAKRFIASLPEMREGIFPENSHYFVAIGAALYSRQLKGADFSISRACASLQNAQPENTATALPPLFSSREEYRQFTRRHPLAVNTNQSLEAATGNAWLGLDCGSTTIKAVVIDDAGGMLYSFYQANQGDPVKVALQILKDIYRRKSPALVLRGGCATGYGSGLLVAALRLDIDEVETVAHLTAARFFEPEVSFILDIGGQDIKCMRIKNGIIDRISLNEACSAGCGSFIQNFANSLDLSLPAFIGQALNAKAPVDLGTRCTVFMNSKVKQAQKEGAAIGDLAAGLAYSVVRNALFKVMKITDVGALGGHMVAQGGAFLNDALLRALELELGIKVTRPAISGLMGAFGAALIAKKRLWANHASRLLSAHELDAFSMRTKTRRCGGCANACLLTVSVFPDKRVFIAGNRCERPLKGERRELPNLFTSKYERLFSHYHALAGDEAWRGVIGIPRCLNMYEDYPLWFTIFTTLGFRVELSGPSSREKYFAAFDTVFSQTVCYPAKLAHAHVLDLVARGVKTIFYPCVKKERHDGDFMAGLYNCPVVAGYPEPLVANMSALKRQGVTFIHDFLPLSREHLGIALKRLPLFAEIPLPELQRAVEAGFAEMDNFRKEMREAGDAALAALASKGEMGLVLAGHPYHLDPEVNHGLAQLVNSCGLAVLTEDSVAHLAPDVSPLRVVNQWAYHSRLYQAGAALKDAPYIGILQLVSFGCGLDAVTTDQLEEISTVNGHIYAQLKIDEGGNLGPARIRIRSMLAAMREKKALCEKNRRLPPGPAANGKQWPVFLPEMRSTHRLLVPQMSPLHFQFAREIFAADGYDAELLVEVDRKTVETGLRYVNNDACFPAIIVVGQLIAAVKSGKYDPQKVALVISQTGGGCRATNYIALLRKALADAGYGFIPIVNFSTGIEGPGIRLSWPLIKRLIMAGHYGDALMRGLHRLRPYEREKGATEELIGHWSQKAAGNILDASVFRFQRDIFGMSRDFDRLALKDGPRRPRIGLVGEILLKYHPYANNNAAGIIESEGGEAVVTDIMDFMMYSAYGHVFDCGYLGGSHKKSVIAKMLTGFLQLTRQSLRLAFGKSRRLSSPARFADLLAFGKKVLSLGHQTGEGWLLCAEMARMLESGVTAILCMQPFGCLPNHIVGKGFIGRLKKLYPNAVIMPLDYDPGTSHVNQMNRIKLMMRSGLDKGSQTAPSFE